MEREGGGSLSRSRAQRSDSSGGLRWNTIRGVKDIQGLDHLSVTAAKCFDFIVQRSVLKQKKLIWKLCCSCFPLSFLLLSFSPLILLLSLSIIICALRPSLSPLSFHLLHHHLNKEMYFHLSFLSPSLLLYFNLYTYPSLI